MKKDQRGKVIELLKRNIPRTSSGDPGFTHLYNEEFDKGPYTGPWEEGGKSLLEIFSAEEIVALCNRALYQADYQRSWHRQWERQKSEELAPLKEKVCAMFKLRKWTEATEEQLRAAKHALEKETK